MDSYRAPLADIGFTLRHFADYAAIEKLPGFGHATGEVVAGLVEAAGSFAASEFAPLNLSGDRQGCRRLEDGSVATPDGFVEAYRAFVRAGWGSVSFAEEYGGGGFPWVVGTALQEVFFSANMALSMCPGLTQGAIDLLEAYADDSLKSRYLPKLVSGEWSGTMLLTEPDAGSDLGAIRTTAVRQEDGAYRLFGNKIFISWGEHDLTDNIVHLVLARVSDAPPGSRGISCFVVPKMLIDGEGAAVRNDVTCLSIEHKLGIRASPTCTLALGDQSGAVGFLVGEENQGLRLMFTMMNQARLAVGVQGLAVAERSYQRALTYARERRQGRFAGSGIAGSVPIIDHPDVRRMLLTMKASIEAMRRLTYWTAAEIDWSRRDPDLSARERAADVASLLTPLTKAWCTETANTVVSIGVQVHGGTGYIEETGAAQQFRDARITPIYEGTNGIQAIDLVLRKLTIRGGKLIGEHLAAIAATGAALAAEGEPLAGTGRALQRAAEAAAAATDWIATQGQDVDEILGVASPYLQLLSTTTAGWLMARSALVAHRELAVGVGDIAFLRAKVATGRFFCEQLLPPTVGLVDCITSGIPALKNWEDALLEG